MMTNLDRNMPKDCWVNESGEEGCIQSIGKSDSDEYLNCNSLDLKGFDPDDPASLKKLKQDNCKLKS